MTPRSDLDRALEAWFDGDAVAPAPADRAAAIPALIARHRPVAGWHARIDGGWPAPSAGVLSFARSPALPAWALAVLLVALLGLAMLVGSRLVRDPSGPPFRLGSLAYDAAGEIWTADWDGANAVKLTTGTDPRWSPDGRHLLFQRIDPAHAFISPAEHTTVVIADTAGRELATFPGWMSSWSPAGDRIATWADARHIAILTADGAAITTIDGVSRLGDEPPQWAPDGQAIIGVEYEPGPDQTGTIWRIPTDGSPRTRSATTWGAFDAALSPDGTWLATLSRSTPSSSGTLAIQHPDGSDRRNVLDGAALPPGNSQPQPLAPLWSPAGDRVAFSAFWSDPLWTGQVWIYDVTARTTTRASDVPAWPVRWSPDGSSLLVMAFGEKDSRWSEDRHGVAIYHRPPSWDGAELWRIGADGSDNVRIHSAWSGDWQWVPGS